MHAPLHSNVRWLGHSSHMRAGDLPLNTAVVAALRATGEFEDMSLAVDEVSLQHAAHGWHSNGS